MSGFRPRLRVIRRIARAAPVATLLACTAAGSDADVEKPFGAPLALGTVPLLQIGVASGDTLQEFHRVVSPFQRADGSIVVPLAGSFEIRIFDRKGQFLRSLGREGAGPGEFRSITMAWERGDTIEVFDGRLDRITRFLPSNTVEAINLRGPLPDMSWAAPVSDGWVVAGVVTGEPGRRDSIQVRHFGRDGVDRGPIAAVPGYARYSASGYSGPAPLSPRPILAAAGDRVYVGDSLEPAIGIHDAIAGTVSEIRWAFEPRDPEATLRAVVDSAIARAAPDRVDDVRRMLEAAPAPHRVPIAWMLIVDELGFLWIRSFDPLADAAAFGGLAHPGVGGRWTVIGTDGQIVRTVTMPADFEPVQIRANAITGIARDELGVETVRVLPLTRS